MSTRCDACGAEYPSTKGFSRQPIGIGKYRLVCPSCGQRQTERIVVFTAASTIISIIMGMVFIQSPSSAPVGRFVLYCAAFGLTLAFSSVPHELGHALAAWAVGMRLFTVNIGISGRVLVVLRILGYDFAFRSIPYGGYVLSTPRRIRLARTRYFLVVLAGPMTTVLLIVLAQWMFTRFGHQDLGYCTLAAVIHGNLLLLVLGLFPRTVLVDMSRVPNDGLLLLTIPFTPRETVKAWHSSTLYYEVLEALQRNNLQDAERWLSKGMELYPNDLWTLLGRAGVLEEQQEYRAAREAYLSLLNPAGNDA